MLTFDIQINVTCHCLLLLLLLLLHYYYYYNSCIWFWFLFDKAIYLEIVQGYGLLHKGFHYVPSQNL